MKIEMQIMVNLKEHEAVISNAITLKVKAAHMGTDHNFGKYQSAAKI